MYVPRGNLHAYVTYSELLGECVTTNSLSSPVSSDVSSENKTETSLASSSPSKVPLEMLLAAAASARFVPPGASPSPGPITFSATDVPSGATDGGNGIADGSNSPAEVCPFVVSIVLVPFTAASSSSPSDSPSSIATRTRRASSTSSPLPAVTLPAGVHRNISEQMTRDSASARRPAAANAAKSGSASPSSKDAFSNDTPRFLVWTLEASGFRVISLRAPVSTSVYDALPRASHRSTPAGSGRSAISRLIPLMGMGSMSPVSASGSVWMPINRRRAVIWWPYDAEDDPSASCAAAGESTPPTAARPAPPVLVTLTPARHTTESTASAPAVTAATLPPAPFRLFPPLVAVDAAATTGAFSTDGASSRRFPGLGPDDSGTEMATTPAAAAAAGKGTFCVCGIMLGCTGTIPGGIAAPGGSTTSGGGVAGICRCGGSGAPPVAAM
mmetsp:Transcript_4165/g.11297  ORF Transcript_4165/g.11297 Transcript_4165/m.11297 type:complete len:442 (-) Transcript_4165:891-2216(-)